MGDIKEGLAHPPPECPQAHPALGRVLHLDVSSNQRFTVRLLSDDLIGSVMLEVYIRVLKLTDLLSAGSRTCNLSKVCVFVTIRIV